MYGREPPRLLHYDRGTAITFEVDRYLRERDQILEELRAHFLRAQQLMKKKADATRRDVSFEVGERVYLKLRPYRQMTVARRSNQKLEARFYGPFEIIDRVGAVAYCLKLPDSATIHSVFHVSQLRKAVGEQNIEKELPGDFSTETTLLPKEVRGTRELGGVREVLVAWDGAAPGEETWLTIEEFQRRFPDFHLEDKVVFRGESIDTNQVTREKSKHWGAVYKRRATTQVQGV